MKTKKPYYTTSMTNLQLIQFSLMVIKCEAKLDMRNSFDVK